MSVMDLWETSSAMTESQAERIIERLERIERMLGAGSVRTVTEVQRRTRQEVAQAIENGNHTRRTIAGEVRVSMQRVSEALQTLEDEGRVHRETRPTGGKGRPMNWYTLVYAEPPGT